MMMIVVVVMVVVVVMMMMMRTKFPILIWGRKMLVTVGLFYFRNGDVRVIIYGW